MTRTGKECPPNLDADGREQPVAQGKRKRGPAPPGTYREARKLARVLWSRGFGPAHIRKVIRERGLGDPTNSTIAYWLDQDGAVGVAS